MKVITDLFNDNHKTHIEVAEILPLDRVKYTLSSPFNGGKLEIQTPGVDALYLSAFQRWLVISSLHQQGVYEQQWFPESYVLPATAHGNWKIKHNQGLIFIGKKWTEETPFHINTRDNEAAIGIISWYFQKGGAERSGFKISESKLRQQLNPLQLTLQALSMPYGYYKYILIEDGNVKFSPATAKPPSPLQSATNEIGYISAFDPGNFVKLCNYEEKPNSESTVTYDKIFTCVLSLLKDGLLDTVWHEKIEEYINKAKENKVIQE